jgi:hypothetical protein
MCAQPRSSKNGFAGKQPASGRRLPSHRHGDGDATAMNPDQAVGGANDFHFPGRGGTVRAPERLAAKGGVGAVDFGSIEHVQDAVVVDAPVQLRSAPTAHAPAVNTGTAASQRTSANLVYQAAG